MVNGFDEKQVLIGLNEAAAAIEIGKNNRNSLYPHIKAAAAVIDGLKVQKESIEAIAKLRGARIDALQAECDEVREAMNRATVEREDARRKLEQINGAYRVASDRANAAEDEVNRLKKANAKAAKEIAELKRKLAAALPKCDISAQIARALDVYRVEHGQPAEQIIMNKTGWEMFKAEVETICRPLCDNNPGYWTFRGVPVATTEIGGKPRFVLFGGKSGYDIEW